MVSKRRVLTDSKVTGKWVSQTKSMASVRKKGNMTAFRKVAQLRDNYAREFYTKVFAYRLAIELRSVQRRLELEGKSLSVDTIKKSNELIKALSPFAEGAVRKGYDAGYNIIQGPIRIFSPKGFLYKNISIEDAQKFIAAHKGIVSSSRLEKIKPKPFTYFERFLNPKKSTAMLRENPALSVLKRAEPATFDELYEERRRLENIVGIHRAGGDEEEAEEMSRELEKVNREIQKRKDDEAKKKTFV